MIDSSLLTDKANSKNPTCEMVEKASNRFSLYCANPTTVPMTKENKDVVNNRFLHRFKDSCCSTALAGAGDHRSPAPTELVSPRGYSIIIPSKGPLASPMLSCSSNKNRKIDILGITVNQVVTMVGTPS